VDTGGNRDELPVGDIRAGFLRFQTSVFKNYRSFIADSSHAIGGKTTTTISTTELFDATKFIHQFDRDSHSTMAAILSTQLWSAFLQNRIDVPREEGNATISGDAVRYFDEQIIAKMNRSFMTSKRKTPFLNDTRWVVTDSFTVPLPSTLQLQRPSFTTNGGNNSDRYVQRLRLRLRLRLLSGYLLRPSVTTTSVTHTISFTFHYRHLWQVRVRPWQIS
jgi:hypothetical protein